MANNTSFLESLDPSLSDLDRKQICAGATAASWWAESRPCKLKAWREGSLYCHHHISDDQERAEYQSAKVAKAEAQRIRAAEHAAALRGYLLTGIRVFASESGLTFPDEAVVLASLDRQFSIDYYGGTMAEFRCKTCLEDSPRNPSALEWAISHPAHAHPEISWPVACNGTCDGVECVVRGEPPRRTAAARKSFMARYRDRPRLAAAIMDFLYHPSADGVDDDADISMADLIRQFSIDDDVLRFQCRRCPDSSDQASWSWADDPLGWAILHAAQKHPEIRWATQRERQG